MSDLKQRVITALIGVVILFTVLYLGGIYLNVAIVLVSFMAILEFYNALKHVEINLNLISIGIGIICLFIFDIYSVSQDISIIIVMLISLFFMLFTNKYTLNDTATSVFAFVYIPYMFNLLNKFDGTAYLLLVFLIAFGTDTFAYFSGSIFGRHKLLEQVSPKKSVEGAIGGTLCATIIALIYFYFMKIPINVGTASLVIVASIAGQIGDLTASKIKRIAGIKDYGKILPGHGGIMDRFDSTIMVIPFVYVLFFVQNLY